MPRKKKIEEVPVEEASTTETLSEALGVPVLAEISVEDLSQAAPIFEPWVDDDPSLVAFISAFDEDGKKVPGDAVLNTVPPAHTNDYPCPGCEYEIQTEKLNTTPEERLLNAIFDDENEYPTINNGTINNFYNPPAQESINATVDAAFQEVIEAVVPHDEWLISKEEEGETVMVPSYLTDTLEKIIVNALERLQDEIYGDNKSAVVLSFDETETMLRLAHAGELMLGRRFAVTEEVADVLTELRERSATS